jgi:hypothetical protein
MLKHYIVLYKEWLIENKEWSLLLCYRCTADDFAQAERNFEYSNHKTENQIVSITVSEYHDN